MLFRSDGISDDILTLCACNGEGLSTEVISLQTLDNNASTIQTCYFIHSTTLGRRMNVVQLSNLAPNKTRAKPCRRSSTELCWLRAMTS